MIATRVGYTGGSTSAPTYHDLADHTEALQVDFDPAVISYAEVLRVFWAEHDPAARPWSTQYRAALWVNGPEQRRVAEAQAAELERSGKTVRTPILDAGPWWNAEDHHQKWKLRRSGAAWAEWLLGRVGGEAALRDSTAAARLNAWFGGNGGRPPEAAALERDLGLGPADAARLARELARR